MKNLTVACIGSRALAQEELEFCKKIGVYLAKNNFTVKSGNAKGADQAYARGANTIDASLVSLFLPWNNYEKEAICSQNVVTSIIQPWWIDEVRTHHPVGNRLSGGVLKLMARNIGIISGASQVVAYPHPEANGSGGTWFGMQYAIHLGIEVLDMNNLEDRSRVEKLIT